MEYKIHKNGSYNIHTIKTEKFKNVRMEVIFRNNFEKDEFLKRNILFNLLTESNNTYKSRRDLLIKRENLYDAYIFSSNNRMGGEVINRICVDFINPKYTDEKDYLKEIISLVFDLIFNPDLVDGVFKTSSLEEQKKIIKSNLDNIRYNPPKYAIREALKNASKDASFSSFYTEDDLDNVDEYNLYQMYQYILKHDYIDIFLVGDIDFDESIDLINQYAKFNTIKTHQINENKKLKPRTKYKEIKEKGEFLQTQLVYVLSVNAKNLNEEMYISNIYDTVLGGNGLGSLLSKYLREDNSLVYSVSSYYQRLDGFMIIVTSLDKKDVKLAKKLIMKCLKDIELGKYSDQLIDNAKANICLDLKGRQDYIENILDEHLMQYLNILEPVNKRIKEYNKVTKDDIKKVASKIRVNTIYELESGE